MLSLALAALAPPSPTQDLSALAWLAGAWVDVESEEAVTEVWLPPRGGLMLGVHQDTRGASPFFEYLRIEATDDPHGPVYWASPLGRPATPFHATLVEENRVRFENPEHDFPRSIEYRRDGDRLEMIASGENRTARWEMVRQGSPWD